MLQVRLVPHSWAQIAKMQAAEAYSNGRDPYVHPVSVAKSAPVVVKSLTQAPINECLITGNPAQLALLTQKNNCGVDQRIATPFGTRNERGERGLNARELTMAKDLAEMKRSIAMMTCQPVPTINETISA